MNMQKVKKKTICDIHNDIKDRASDISRINPKLYENVEDLFCEIESIADDIYILADKAMECGEGMEGRLRAYRSSIERLGFERTKEEEDYERT